MTSDTVDIWNKKWAGRDGKVNPFARKCLSHFQKYKCGNLIDLGSGDGADSMYFAGHSISVTSIDISSKAVEHLQVKADKEELDVTTNVCDISKQLPFDDSAFDAVYAHLSIHYFDDKTTRAIIEEIDRILKPGGVLCIKCKSVDDPLFGLGEEVGTNMFFKEYIRHFFSKEYMAEIISSFEILEIEKSSHDYWSRPSAFIEAIALKKMSTSSV